MLFKSFNDLIHSHNKLRDIYSILEELDRRLDNIVIHRGTNYRWTVKTDSTGIAKCNSYTTITAGTYPITLIMNENDTYIETNASLIITEG